MLSLRQGRHQAAIEASNRPSPSIPARRSATTTSPPPSACGLGNKEQAVCATPSDRLSQARTGAWLLQQLGPGPGPAGGRRQQAIAAFAQALRTRTPSFPEAHSNWGIRLFEQGQATSTQAVEQFRQALLLDPALPQGPNNLGLALCQLGRSGEALASFSEAVRLKPGYVEALYNQANLHRDQGRLDDALNCYRRVLHRTRFEYRDARHQLAVLTLARQGNLDQAIAGLHQCLLFDSQNADTYNQLGVLLCQRDRLDEAIAAFDNALRLKPEHAEALNNKGHALLRQHKTGEAVRCFEQALALNQDYPQPYCNLGMALLQQGKAAEAVSHFQQALRLQPNYADAHVHLGNAYRSLGRPGDAVSCYRQVLELQPDNAGARLNLGVALSEQGQLDDAALVLEDLLGRKPDFPQAHNSLGVTRLHQGRVHDGLNHFAEGIRLAPQDADSHLNRALTLLLLGNWEEGWPEYEWRWKLKKAMPCPHAQPAWDGSALPTGTILLWAEQGLGDTLQFARYAALVKERVGTVLLDCPAPLRGLLASCPGVDGLVGPGEALPAIDVQAPLMSLPRLLGSTPATVPASVPYLFADVSLQDRWRDRIGHGKGLKVGINWQGNPQFGGDRYRSVPLEQFRPLAGMPGVRLFSLQKGKGSEQLAGLASELGITDLGSQISGDFRDTAAAMLNLDLVVSTETAIAHLAGAAGLPLWVLLAKNPDWASWLLDRPDSVWYPSRSGCSGS